MNTRKELLVVFLFMLLQSAFGRVDHHGLTNQQWKYFSKSSASQGTEAEYYADSLLELSTEQNSLTGQLYAHLRYLDIAYTNKELEKTNNECKKVCELSRATNDMSHYYYAKARAINLHILKRMYTECPPLLFEMKKDLETLYNDPAGWALYYYVIGRYQQVKMIYGDAEKFLTKSIEIAQKQSNMPPILYHAMLDRCWSYIGLEMYEKVLEETPVILKYDLTPSEESTCHVFTCLASACLKKKDVFFENYQKIQKIKAEVTNKPDSIFVEAFHDYFTKGSVNWAYYKKVLIDIKFAKLEYLINKIQGNYAKALECHEEFAALQRKYFGEVYNTDASLMNIQLVNDELDRQNKDLKNKQEIQQKELNLLLSIVGLLAISFTLLVFVNKNRYKRKELKKLEAANIVANDKLEKAIAREHAKTKLIQNMSHEIRTPLNSVIGFSQLLTLPQDMVSDEERQDYVNFINTNSQLLTILVEDILTISDVEHDNMYINIDKCNLNEIGKQAIMTCEYKCKNGVDMRFESSLSDEVFTYSDPHRVLQVLINYLGNACKNTTQGHIILSCEKNEKDNTIVYAVTDTGCGVPVEQRKNIFERYKKLNLTQEGSGIGLHICKNIAKKLNGTVMMDESYNDGARFLFILPINTMK